MFVGSGDPRRQLNYVERYVKRPELGCSSVVHEQHYIDRDHMEDHSVFYSKSLRQYRNSCQRLHFFSLNVDELRREINRLRGLALRAPPVEDTFAHACAEFSRLHYIGFAVIKPLPGCPVGRTVLRCLPAESDKGHTRHFDCALDYDVHLLGVPLRVRGLAFQQQDIGVSACATTALWTSLQKARQLEQAGFATPAQITIRASQFSLPFGRPMPSEGLSVDQMCQAVQALGHSPSVYRSESFQWCRALLHSAVTSGISPVLVMKLMGTKRNIRHAVAVAGMALDNPTEGLATAEMGHASAGLVALYVHDDRNGPYLKGIIEEQNEDFVIQLPLRNNPTEMWLLTHILVPIHVKIRLSLLELYRAGLSLLADVQGFVERRLAVKEPATSWSSRVVRSYGYVESLVRDERTAKLVNRFCQSVPLPRYLGVIRVEVPTMDPFDVLLDTTSTERNVNCIAVIPYGKSHPTMVSLCQFIAEQYQCKAFAAS